MASLLVTVFVQYQLYLFAVLKPCGRHGDPAKYYCIAYKLFKTKTGFLPFPSFHNILSKKSMSYVKKSYRVSRKIE